MVYNIHGMKETTVKQMEDQGTSRRFPEGGQKGFSEEMAVELRLKDEE